jgi:hypothetical protein
MLKIYTNQVISNVTFVLAALFAFIAQMRPHVVTFLLLNTCAVKIEIDTLPSERT